VRGEQRVDDRIQLSRSFRKVPRIIEHRFGRFPGSANGVAVILSAAATVLALVAARDALPAIEFVAAACSFTADATDSAVAAMSKIVLPVLTISLTEH
jgi:hypothetical protein